MNEKFDKIISTQISFEEYLKTYYEIFYVNYHNRTYCDTRCELCTDCDIEFILKNVFICPSVEKETMKNKKGKYCTAALKREYNDIKKREIEKLIDFSGGNGEVKKVNI